MKEFKICLYGKSFNIIKDEDGFFKMPEELKKYDGFNVNLKPAHEPMVLARKPLSEKTVAENVLKWGVGAINIDESRVRVSETGATKRSHHIPYETEEKQKFRTGHDVLEINNLGRWPANLIHDGSDEVKSIFPETKSNNSKRNRNSIGSFGMPNDNTVEYNDSGNASRYFYCAKASKKDRNDGLDGFELKINGIGALSDNGRKSQPRANFHPTVKPTDLMAYLVKLITPKGGTVLDPFNGSGSTGKACAILSDRNYKYIGIDLSQEYLDISKARIENELNKK